VAVTLGRLLNRSVAFEHANGTLLAHHSVAAVDAVRRQSIQRTATPKRIQRVLERDGYLDAIRRASSSVEIPAIPALGMAARLAAPIRLGGEFVGCVWIIQGDRPIGDLDRRAAEHAALIAALQIARLRELEAIEHRLGSDLVTALLDEGIEITPELLERATLHGFDPDAAYRVAVIVFDERNVDDPTRFRRLERFVVRLRRQIADRGIPPLVASTHREVAALLREDVPLSTLTDVIKDGPAPRVVVGRPARGIAGIRRSRAEAYALLAAGVPGVVADYEALLVPRTLLGDREARAALIESILGVLRRERNGDRLVETLDAFVAAGFTRAAAAERLGVHPNTLRYRLGRIERVLGIEFDNQQTRFTLQLVLYLLSISYKNDPPNL
ncbi:MAG: PucR family transcriptional regulator, partial [Vulcanimicrobiaceae bacterium]